MLPRRRGGEPVPDQVARRRHILWVGITASDEGHNPRARSSTHQGRERLASDLGVVERQHLSADDLPDFVAFSGEDEDVAGAQFCDSRGNRGAPLADLHPARGGGQVIATDIGRRLAGRVLVGEV
jgi:hypothetical protein